MNYLKRLLVLLEGEGDGVHHPLRQFARFGVVGILGCGINYSLFYLFYKIGLNHVVASQIGYFGAGAVVFIINRRWTFKASSNNVSRQALMFMVFMVFSALADMAVMYCSVDILGIHPLVAKVLALCVTVSMNFTGNKFWVFKRATQT